MSNAENGIKAEVNSLNPLGCDDADAGYADHSSITDTTTEVLLGATNENGCKVVEDQEDLIMKNVDEPDTPFSTPSDYHDPDWEEEYRHYLKIAATFRKYK